MQLRRLLILASSLFLASFAPAADRHVYLDTNGDGFLNQCPNPAHNTFNTPSTGNLQYCVGGSNAGKVIGDKTGYVSSCPSGTVTSLANGLTADVDGDGTGEVVYGHPQPCVYNMAPSDSCEVHAGTYRTPGAECNLGCGDHNASDGAPVGTPTDYSGWFAVVWASGYGPNLSGTGYGTAANPGYLRGASMNGSIDTWDSNNNKVPDALESVTSYPAIFSGDINNDGVYQATSCTTTSCSTTNSDMYYGVIVGCGDPSSTTICDASLDAGETRPILDTNGDGTRETPSPAFAGVKPTHHFILKDIEFTHFNQGNNDTTNSGRYLEAIIAMPGDGSSNGMKVDHVYGHANAYQGGCPTCEIYWAFFSDLKNSGCVGFTEFKNSYVESNNKHIFNNDCGINVPCGCSHAIHDSRFLMNITSSGVSGGHTLGYWKSIDTLRDGVTPKWIRFYNNEVIYESASPTSCSGSCNELGFDGQALGNSLGHSKGELWFYGNIIRNDPSPTNAYSGTWMPQFCGGGTGNTKLYWMNNTIDGWSAGSSFAIGNLCAGGNALYVGKNNVELNVTGEQATTATTTRIFNNFSADANRCTNYFTCGGGTPTYFSGLSYYKPATGGALDEIATNNPCDPDGDGVAGMDYDGDGVNDTTWTDIAGNTVQCPTASTPLDAGAVQSSSDGGCTSVCGDSSTTCSEACDDGNTTSESACPYGTPTCTACNATCTAVLNLTGPFCGDNIVNGSEPCDGSALGGATCSSRGCSSGTLACTACAFNLSGCTGCAPSTIKGAKLSGGNLP